MKRLRHKDGTFRIKPEWGGIRLLIATVAIGAFINWLYADPPKPVSPMAEAQEVSVPAPTINPTANMDTDALIDYYAEKYTTSPSTKAHRKALLHCLYWKETRGGIDADAHGDNGLAGGPFQFHEPTYRAMRRKMIEAGLVNDLGTRYDFEDAVETTSWAISQGQGKQWGPLLRGECK